MKQTAAILEFGSSKVVCLIGEAKSYSRFDIIGIGVCEYEGYKDGAWLCPERLNDVIHSAVREAEIKSRKKVRNIYVGVPGAYCQVVSAKTSVKIDSRDQRVTEKDVTKLLAKSEEIYRADRYEVIHCAPAYYIADREKKLIDPVGSRTSMLTGLMSHISGDVLFLHDVRERAEELSMHVVKFLPTCLGQAMHFIPPEERDRMAVLVDVGYRNTEVAIIEGDGIVYLDNIPMGGFHIANDISIGMEIPLEHAEQLKRRVQLFTKTEANAAPYYTVTVDDKTIQADTAFLQVIVDARVEEICEYISSSIMYSGYKVGERSPVYLSGGGMALMRNASQALSSRLKRNVKIASPQVASLGSPVFSSALGLLDNAFLCMKNEEPKGGGLAGLFGKN